MAAALVTNQDSFCHTLLARKDPLEKKRNVDFGLLLAAFLSRSSMPRASASKNANFKTRTMAKAKRENK
jgi:hypothetical protein